jgi:hypothetical protein
VRTRTGGYREFGAYLVGGAALPIGRLESNGYREATAGASVRHDCRGLSFNVDSNQYGPKTVADEAPP